MARRRLGQWPEGAWVNGPKAPGSMARRRLIVNTLLYYIHDSSTEFRFQLSGDLSGDGVREVEQAWRTAFSTIGERRFVVDITNLSGMDESGRALIEKWHHRGALLVAKSCKAKARIQGM